MKKEKNVKKAFLWNMIGSTCYSGSSFLYLLVVTRICGATPGRFLSHLSYATAQLLLQVGRYGVRTYQATDLNQKYILFRIQAFQGNYLRIDDAVWNYIQLFQLQRRIYYHQYFYYYDENDRCGGGCFPRKSSAELSCGADGKGAGHREIVYSAVFFTGILMATKSLYITCTATAVTSLTLCLAVNSWFARRYGSRRLADTLPVCTTLAAWRA